LAKAEARRDRLQKNNDVLQRLVARQAATQDELAAKRSFPDRGASGSNQIVGGQTAVRTGVKLDTGQTTLRVQQTQNEVAALDEKVRQGRIVAPADGTLYSLPAKAGIT